MVGHQHELVQSCPAIEGRQPWCRRGFWFNEMNHLFLFLRNSFLNQQAINQWLAIDWSIQFVLFSCHDPAIGTISSTPDDILNGVNSQIRLTRRLASRRPSDSAIQAENR